MTIHCDHGLPWNKPCEPCKTGREPPTVHVSYLKDSTPIKEVEYKFKLRSYKCLIKL